MEDDLDRPSLDAQLLQPDDGFWSAAEREHQEMLDNGAGDCATREQRTEPELGGWTEIEDACDDRPVCEFCGQVVTDDDTAEFAPWCSAQCLLLDTMVQQAVVSPLPVYLFRRDVSLAD